MPVIVKSASAAKHTAALIQCNWCVSRYTCMRKREFIAGRLSSLADGWRRRIREGSDRRDMRRRADRNSSEHGHTD
jgi:hypothetical protein